MSRIQRAQPQARAVPDAKARRRTIAVTAVVVIAMAMVGLFLTGLGWLALKASGGAADDTRVVVMLAAFGITDFWGGAIVAVVARRTVRDATISWTAGRVALLAVSLIVLGMRPWIVVLQALVAAPAAFIGARLADRNRDVLAERMHDGISSTRPSRA